MLPLITQTFILNLVIFASFPLSSNSQELYQALAGIVEAVKVWQINGITLTDTSKLSDYYGSGYLGGPGKLISGDTLKRTYTSLPSHNMISFWLYINLLDDWTPGGTITVEIDNQPRFSFTPQTIIQTQSLGNFGGSPSPDALRTMIGRFYHSGQALTFTMVSTPSNLLASFGINYVKMILRDVPAVGATEMFCIHENVPGTNAFSGACRCDLGHYFDSITNSCRSCDSSCVGCFGPTKADCLACADSYTYQTDLGYCSPLASDCLLGVGGQENQCDMCQPGYYLYWNHTCQTSCLSPLVPVASGLKICQTPCTASGAYALQDYTCATSCNAPMQVRIEDVSKFCDSPCPDSILSWDGSCLITCPSPYILRSYGGNNYCDACRASTDYMYPDSTCQPSCSSPYIQQRLGGSNFCLYPCQNGGYYNDETSKCQATCEYPYIVQNNAFCVLDLPPEQALQMEKIASAAGVGETTGTALGASVTLINFGNPTAIFVNAFADMISKLKYLNIGYPAKLILFFENSVKAPFIGVPEHVVEKMSKSSLSGTFKRYNTYSSFLVNLWQPIILLSIIITVLGFVCVMCLVTARYKRVHSICLKIRTGLKWNFSLTFFTSYFGDIVLYSSFEAENADFQSVDSIASFILCFLVNLVVFISFFKMLTVVASQHFSEIRQKIKSVFREDKEQEEFNAVLKNFKSTTFIQQGFFFIFVARIYIFAAVIAYLYNYPLAQAILVLLLSFFMLLYLALLRPLKSKVDLGQYIMQEIVMLIITVCVLILGIFDKASAQNFEARKTLGDIILGSNMALKAIGLVYLGIRTCITLFGVINAAIHSSKGQNVKNQIIERPEITVSYNETSKPTLEFPEKVKVSISSPKGTNLRVVDLNVSKRPKQTPETLATPQMSRRAKIEFVRPIFGHEAGNIESDLSFNNDSALMLQPNNMRLENSENSENYENDLKKLIAESHKSYNILANSLKKSSS